MISAKKSPPVQRDEIGFLVESFNEMTQALKSASQEAEESRAELQAQGEYLETVLGNLSSGVLTLDTNCRMITTNAACNQILGLPDGSGHGTRRPIAGSPAPYAPFLETFIDAVNQQIERGRTSGSRKSRLTGPERPWSC